MNNNKKNMQPNTASDGDNTINTKKGFLISLPSKKKNGGEQASGIVMAKTVNEPEKPQENNPQNKENNGGGNRHGKNRHRHDNRNRNNANPEQNRKVREAEAVKHAEKNQPEPKKNDRNDRNDKNQKAQNNNQQNNQKKNDKNQNDRRNDKNQKHQQNQHNQNNKNRHQEQKTQNKHDRHNGKQGKHGEFQGLSPLSKDMRDYAGISAKDITNAAVSAEKELSLEEKYKNAVPLAEQIALEEEKRKKKPRAMVTNNIDRTTTGNAELAEIIKEAEANNTEIKMPETDKGFEVVGIRFREAGKVYYFDPDGKDVPYGTPVIVETARGAEYGYTAISNRLVPASSVIPPLKKIKRIATATDMEKYLANKALEADAAEIFKAKVASLGLEMNLIFVEYTFDNSKLLFYFTAETRIDFRELVKELAGVFRTRIELRQIGVRDEAKMLGGLGVCGRSVCCNSFLGDFAQVSIKMAKDQGLSLNSAKISGACGKLMCCLRYEDKVYEEEIARTPKVGSVVETAEGRGVVTEALPLKGIVKVTLEASPDVPAKPYSRDDVKIVGFNKAAVKEDAEEMKELKKLEDNN